MFIPKSRYDTISYFISRDKRFLKEYNDIDFPVNEEIQQFVKSKEKEFQIEIDENLLNHLGFLYLRDPLVIFKSQKIEDPSLTLDFEVIIYC